VNDALLAAAFLAAGIALLHRVLRARLEAALNALTLALVVLGTFAFDLLARAMVRPAAACALAALALFVRERSGLPSARRGLSIGASAGLAAALHWPNAALALLALPRRGEGPRPLAWALAAGVIVWAAVFALAPLPPPMAGRWQPLLSLLGSRQGLLHLTPALWLGVAGLALQLRRGFGGAATQWREPPRPERRDSLPARAARRDARGVAPFGLALTALLGFHAACPLTPAHSCPREQLAAALPLLALPMGEALRALREAVRRAPGAPLWAAGALLVCWNLLFMQQYADDMIPRDFPVAFPRVAQNGAALVARAVGAPLSWPANWVFAARHDVGPERFDAAAGKRLAQAADGSITIDVGQLDVDEALLLEGWSVRHPCGEAVCRAVESRARVLLPVMSNGWTALTVRASGEGWLDIEPGHWELNAPAPLGPEPADLCFVPDPARRGMRALTLGVSATPRAPVPHALVDRITLSPGPCP